MKYNTSIITYFVVPSGATSGQRIVLDGVKGEFDLFDSANNLVGKWNPTGFFQFKSGSANQGLSLSPNANGFPTLAFATGAGNVAFINAVDDGSGDAMVGVNSGNYANAAAIQVFPRLFLNKNFIQLAFVSQVAEAPNGAQIYATNQQAGLEAYGLNSNTPAVQAHLDVDGTAHTVTMTPDSTQTGGSKTPTLQAVYSTSISSAFLKVLGAGVWATITMQGGYAAGNPAPAITLLPDGTLAFRGVMTTRAAPVSGDTCMTTGAALAPSATRALLVFTLLNPNTVLQLNWNTNGTFQLFGGGPNPPGNTGVSLDSIPPIPVAF